MEPFPLADCAHMLSLDLQRDNKCNGNLYCLYRAIIMNSRSVEIHLSANLCLYPRPPCKINVIFEHTSVVSVILSTGGVCVFVRRMWPPCSGFLSISRMHSGSGKGHGWKQGYYWLPPYSWRKLLNVSKSYSGRDDHTAVCILALFYGGICLWVSSFPVT